MMGSTERKLVARPSIRPLLLAVRPVAGLQEGGDVGAPEAVDGLLGVAHEEETARIGLQFRPSGTGSVGSVAAEQRSQLYLDRVGVLELVDEQALVALPQGGPHFRAVGVVAQQQAGPHQKVMEFEAPAGAPLLRGVAGEVSQPRHEHLQRGLCCPVQCPYADRQRVVRLAAPGRGQGLERGCGGCLVGLALAALSPVVLAARTLALPGLDGRSENLDPRDVVPAVVKSGELTLDSFDPSEQRVFGAR